MRIPRPKFGWWGESPSQKRHRLYREEVERLITHGDDVHPAMLWWDGPDAPELRDYGIRAYTITGPCEIRIGYGITIKTDEKCVKGSGMPPLFTEEERNAGHE